MKLKTIILCAVMAVIGCANALADGFSTQLYLEPIETGFKKNTNNFSVGVEARYQVQRILHLGLGVKVWENWNFKTSPDIPLYVGLHVDNYYSPICVNWDLETGVSFATDKANTNSYFLNPMWGYRFGDFSFHLGYYGGIPLKGDDAKWFSGMNFRIAYLFR